MGFLLRPAGLSRRAMPRLGVIGEPPSAYNARPHRVSLAHELSGLGSTRVVRFSASGWRRINEPGDVATGSAHAEVSGRFEPMGTAGTIDGGGGGSFWECRNASSDDTGGDLGTRGGGE